MALTITYDGYGVVANADLKVNDTGGSGTGDWRELGGGTISENPDVYLYSGAAVPASIGSKYATKTGYTYIDGITALDFSVGGAQESEYIYCWINIQSAGAFAPLATNGLSIMIGSATGDSYEWKIAGSDDANGWSGGWKLFVIDPTLTTGTITNGTPDISTINTIGIWIDTDVSVRADSIFQSQIFCAKGLKVEGTSTSMYDDIVTWCEDYANRAAGMFQSRGQTYYSLGSLTIHSDTANTIVSSDGSNVEYEKSEFWNGTAWVTSYPTTANVVTVSNSGGNTVTMEDSNVGLSGNSSNKVSIDTSNATSFDKSGGYIKYLSTLSSTSNDTYNGVVFSLYDARTLGVEPYSSCTFDGGSSLTLTATSSFTGDNIVNGTSGVNSITTPSLNYTANTTFNSSGSNHAVDLTTIDGGSTSWSCVTSGFDSGSVGSPVTPTSTGNEDIYVTAATGTVTINVSAGATTPSIRSAGAIVNVVASFTLTLTDIPSGVNVTIVNSTTRTELQHTTSTGTDITYPHGGGETVDILLMANNVDPNLSDIFDLLLPTSSSSIKFQIITDSNYDNPA